MVSEQDTMISLPILGNLTYREWHAFIDGVFCGTEGIMKTKYTQERHYWRMGYLFGKKVLR